ncbi:ASCH domain-containing protein [Maribacter thermophilus]|uniref:ASCH domain-containing protein n=1 Tax=Maribacter thermophilus TaxID=1197874 RepID=UPI0006418643|nr:ASCH domain-containing protein [Maribacter thermophilus]
MRNLTIALLFIFIGCKSETKTKTTEETPLNLQTEAQNEVDKSVYEMWSDYVTANPKSENEEIPESDFFHDNEDDANRLAELTLNGKKSASSGLLSLYKKYKVDLPKVGAKQIVTDYNGKAIAIIENKSVDLIPFNEISETYAQSDMGTDIEPLKKWKKAHWNFFKAILEESGDSPTEEMPVVCVRFKTIWPANP